VKKRNTEAINPWKAAIRFRKFETRPVGLDSEVLRTSSVKLNIKIGTLRTEGIRRISRVLLPVHIHHMTPQRVHQLIQAL